MTVDNLEYKRKNVDCGQRWRDRNEES